MIHLTVGQGLTSSILNIIEIIFIYQLVTSDFSLGLVIIDFLAVLMIIFFSIVFFMLGSLYPVLIVFYFWLVDRIKSNSYILKLESTQKDRSRYQLWLFFTKISFKQLHEERFEYFQVSNS